MGLIKRLFVFFLILLILALLSFYWPNLTGESVVNDNEEYKMEPAVVTKIVDGDTIHVKIENGSEEIIRLLGINTPEKRMPYSNEAVNFLKQIENENIEILRDFTDKDKYERKLRYVFYNHRFINLEILEQGLATSFMLEGLKYNEKFRKAEDSAKQNKEGLWKESKDICGSCIKLSELNAENEYFIIRNSCDFSCNLSGWVVKDDANHFFYLEDLNIFESRTYNSNTDEIKKTKDVWNNAGDRFFMRDSKGDLVIFYEYS
jgi:endonuclease YncB( thermonuclease family)